MSRRALLSEWERIELLCAILQGSRTRHDADPADLEKLANIQAEVAGARAEGSWALTGAPHLSGTAMDLLAAVAAPHLSFVVSFAYDAFPGETRHTAPSLRLIKALYSLKVEDHESLVHELRPDGPLLSQGLISVERHQGTEFLHCGKRLRTALFGAEAVNPPPGTVPVTRQAGWDDLVVPTSCERMLHEFLDYIRQRQVVVEHWGAPRTGGPIALFSGFSGTGKTLAASVIASDIGWPLYRVDLGQLVSKYIGETEKNLNALFDSVSGSDTILIFDESDALFGRRGEVKEARDRYANMEVSHLLSRIENQHCPCILTSNLRSSIDSAFLRRFQIIVDFPLPGKPERERLWRHHIPPKAPVDHTVDFASLAGAVQLTGAGIENAALHAAYRAAAGGTPISMALLAQGVWRELCKDGNRHSLSDLGPLADHLKGGSDVENRQFDPASAA